MSTETVSFESVSVGDSLPAKEIPITSALIVGGAIASRDFTPVHHDKKAAQKGGLPDLFMNILTSNGLMGSYVTNWAGPDSTTKKIELKLGAPNLPGFVMTITGEVKARNEDTGVVDVEVVGENNVWGMHMQGTVQVQLPRGGA
jgi:acyl dehydratase